MLLRAECAQSMGHIRLAYTPLTACPYYTGWHGFVSSLNIRSLHPLSVHPWPLPVWQIVLDSALLAVRPRSRHLAQ